MQDERKDKNDQSMNRSNGTDFGNNPDSSGNTELPKGIARVGNTGAEGDASEKIIDTDESNHNSTGNNRT